MATALRRPEGLYSLATTGGDELRLQRRRPPVDVQGSLPHAIGVPSPAPEEALAASFSTVDDTATAWSRAGSSPPSTPREDSFPAARRAYYRRGDIRPRYMRIVFVLLIVVLFIGTYPTDRARELKEIQELYGAPRSNRTTQGPPSTKPSHATGVGKVKVRTASPHRHLGEERRHTAVVENGV